MDKQEIIERLERIADNAVHAVGEKPFIMSLDDGIAVHGAIEIIRKSNVLEVLQEIRQEIKDSAIEWYFGRLDGKSEEVLLLDDALKIIDTHISVIANELVDEND